MSQIRKTLKKTAVNCPQAISYAKDIKPMFTTTDRAHMIAAKHFDLYKYADVKVWAAQIFDQVSSGNMPPPPENQWTTAMVNTFACWVQQGCQP